MAPNILVVEDDADIRFLLEHLLTKEGYRVEAAGDGPTGLERIQASRPDLVVLDLMLPGQSGFEILRRAREIAAPTPPRFLLLTAKKDEVDRVLGFELGADDYVTKPFSTRELVLRIQAILRRGAVEGDVLRAGPIELDLENHVAQVEGRSIHLTLTEFRLLADLVRARGRVRSREALLSELWGYDSDVLSRTVDTHVRRLRDKLGPASGWLGTVRGIGYRIQDPADR